MSHTVIDKGGVENRRFATPRARGHTDRTMIESSILRGQQHAKLGRGGWSS